MNPSQPEQGGAALPTVPEQGNPLAEASAAASAEALPASPEAALALHTPPATQAVPAGAIPLPTAPPAAPGAGVPAPMPLPPASNPLTDDDLIEKEWVSKAKRIVEQTRDDPHKQSEDLTVFKADYLKQRYGKSIKLGQ